MAGELERKLLQLYTEQYLAFGNDPNKPLPQAISARSARALRGVSIPAHPGSSEEMETIRVRARYEAAVQIVKSKNPNIAEAAFQAYEQYYGPNSTQLSYRERNTLSDAQSAELKLASQTAKAIADVYGRLEPSAIRRAGLLNIQPAGDVATINTATRYPGYETSRNVLSPLTIAHAQALPTITGDAHIALVAQLTANVTLPAAPTRAVPPDFDPTQDAQIPSTPAPAAAPAVPAPLAAPAAPTPPPAATPAALDELTQRRVWIEQIKAGAEANNPDHKTPDGKQLKSVDMTKEQSGIPQKKGREAVAKLMEDYFRREDGKNGKALTDEQQAKIGFEKDKPGEFKLVNEDGKIIDLKKVEEATKLYQKAMGLKDDGLVGTSTIAAMNRGDKPAPAAPQHPRPAAARPAAAAAGATPVAAHAVPPSATPVPVADVLTPENFNKLPPEVQQELARIALDKAGIQSSPYFYEVSRGRAGGPLSDQGLAEVREALKNAKDPITLHPDGAEVKSAREAVALAKRRPRDVTEIGAGGN